MGPRISPRQYGGIRNVLNRELCGCRHCLTTLRSRYSAADDAEGVRAAEKEYLATGQAEIDDRKEASNAVSGYMDGMDLPPMDSEDEDSDCSDEEDSPSESDDQQAVETNTNTDSSAALTEMTNLSLNSDSSYSGAA